ncbi:restriction endonuclease subunit S [Nocardia camponoti]|uniref:Type I restriction modification DNA specificity domain-containing protein n=1 Tax=Nocardia camponoti TaxID=1616106 RepID=A0A917V9L6_9NOCA|nr:restriction endonuclease subunit S [Nocardia camponoti]GGK53306.1 hypothetical protein GCM10011591_26400 [Nocardia camponoti]
MKLDDLCANIVDCAHKTAPIDVDGEFFAVGTPAMRGNRINYEEARRVSRETFELWTTRLKPQYGDLLLAREAPVGPVVRIPIEENVAPGQRTVLLRPNPERLDPVFAYYLLASPTIQRRLISMAEGSTVAHLNVADIREMSVGDLPPLAQQRAIAEVLGALDDKIAANSRTIDVTGQLSDALFAKALSHVTTRATIRELASDGVLIFGDGYRTKRSEHGTPGCRIIRAGDIQDGRVVPSGEDFVAKPFLDKAAAKIAQPGDIVLTTKGSVGRVAVVPHGVEPSVYSPQLCYFRVSDDHHELQPWLATWFRNVDRVAQTDVAMHKTDMAPYVNLQDIGSLSVPVPGPNAPSALGKLQALTHRVGAESDVLAKTRDELLPLLMSGKLRIKDAEAKVEEIV